MSEYTESPKKSNLPFVVIILILLIGMAVMAVMLAKEKSALDDCSNENMTLLADMEGMNKMLEGYVGNMSNDLKTDFQNMLKTYDALIEKDKSKADSLNAQKEKIQSLIDELDSNKKMSAQQLYKMKKENETLRNIMKGYVRQIDSLNTLNLKLTSDLDKTSAELSSTKTERDQYKQEAEENAEQVRKGSKLQAYNFSSGALKMRLNNTTEETNRARNAVQFKSSFTISENPIAKAGNKNVYLQVVSPDGKTMQARSSNVIQTDQGSIPYSDAKEINYNNQRIDVTIYYDLKGETAVKGNYKVKIYCDGSLIGTDSFTLK
jgi:DNA repair exonuclease SbcCD ATPase subunit